MTLFNWPEDALFTAIPLVVAVYAAAATGSLPAWFIKCGVAAAIVGVIILTWFFLTGASIFLRCMITGALLGFTVCAALENAKMKRKE